MIDKSLITALQAGVRERMSEKRYIHTLGVMEMASRLGAYCLQEKTDELVCAALLHDVAKEMTDSELISIIQQEYAESEGIISYGREVWHSFASPGVIKRDFVAFATPEILSAVRKHTVNTT